MFIAVEKQIKKGKKQMKNNENHLFRRKIGTRIISLLLTVLVIFFAVPYVAYAETAEALNNLAGEEETTLLSYGKEAAVGGAEIYEAEELRGENTKHFRLTDGSYVLAVYPTNVHRLNEEGKYEDINNRLYNLLGDVINFDGNVKFSKKITGNSKIFTIHSGEGKITFSLTGAKKGTNAEIINNEDDESENELQKKINLENLSSTVIYRDILNGTDIEYVLNGSGIKENIIIKERLDSYSYSFEIAANGYSLQAQDDGSIAVLEEGGEKAFVIPAPIIFDSNGEYGCAEYKLSDENKSGKYILTVAPDYEWINSEERIFPITLDPAIYPSDNYVFDTFTDSNNPSVSYASDAYYYVSESKTTYWKTSNLSFVPKNVYISEVNLVYQLAGETPEAYIGVYPVTTDWNESLTYNKTVASSPQGALGNTSITYTHVKANEGEENDYVFFDITEAFKGWIDAPSQNFGVALKYLLGGEVKFLSPRSTTASVPCLQINYINQNGIEAYNSYSSHRAGEIANGYVNLATGSLVMDIPLLTLTNSVMPYTLSLVYDSKNANSFINKSAGNVPYTTRVAPYGYKWSSQQSVVKTTYTDIFSQTNYLYIWCDADGTEHSFFLSETPGVYKDDGGLGYKLKEASGKVTITFNDKSVYKFSSITTPS